MGLVAGMDRESVRTVSLVEYFALQTKPSHSMMLWSKTNPLQQSLLFSHPFATFPGEAYSALVEQRASVNLQQLEKGLLWARGKNVQGLEK